MAFLKKMLDRPDNERPFLRLIVGYPAESRRVPTITRISLDAIASALE